MRLREPLNLIFGFLNPRSDAERGDPVRILAILKELYGCAESHVVKQAALFSRKQQEGETLLEFSLSLIGLM